MLFLALVDEEVPTRQIDAKKLSIMIPGWLRHFIIE